MIWQAKNEEAIKKDETAAFVNLLRHCAKTKEICKGTKIHDDILRKGLLEGCSDALVTMYAKCGEITKAKDLFQLYKSRDVFTWTALMAGYVQKGQGQVALNLFDQMQFEGLSPDVVTYLCILKACANIRAADKGERVHKEIVNRRLLENNVDLINALIYMYAMCGALKRAVQVLEKLSIRNVFSWNALIAGHVEHGDGEKALKHFERMQQEGLAPNAGTYVLTLKACGTIAAISKGEKIYDEIAKQRLLESNVGVGNALISMYAKCGALAKAKGVLEELHVRNVVSWTALIAGYAEYGEGEKALICFEWMQHEGQSPDAVTYTCVLKACGLIRAPNKGEKIHIAVRIQGLLGNNIALGNALVNMYAKCGALVKAKRVLEELPIRNVISWTTLIEGYIEHGEGERALKCFEQMRQEGISPNAVTFSCILKACGSMRAAEEGEKIYDEIMKQGLLEDDIVIGNALIDMYAKCGILNKARRVLEELHGRDVISWTALIAGYAEHGESEEALICFQQMQREGLSPNAVTFLFILQACGTIKAVEKGKMIEDEMTEQGLLESDLVLGTALVDMYAKCGALAEARRVLEKLPARSVLSWNALITGYAELGEVGKSLDCFEHMQREGISPDPVTFTCILRVYATIGAPDKGERIHCEIAKQGWLVDDIMLGTAIVDMYAKCGVLAKAEQVLKDLPGRDVISWTALIAGYAEHGEGEQALISFERMQQEGLSPNAATFVCILKACGSIGAADKGEEFHDEVAKQGLLGRDILLGNAVLDMYVKCGILRKARKVFEGLPARNVISWTTLIGGYVENGEAEQALSCFEQMQGEGLCPNTVTFVCMLKACGSIGAADKGEKLHREVSEHGLLGSDAVLGTAVVDMYAKCGALAKARRVLEELPARNVSTWNALITGYAEHGEVGQALNCMEQMQAEGLSPDTATFSCVLSACGRLGLVEDAEKWFVNIGSLYDTHPNLEHYTCIVDLLARTGHLDQARGVVEKMPAANMVVWSSLLGACWKWGYVELGRWAFKQAQSS